MASVLIVDDEKDTAEAIQMGFDMAGVTCWVAKDSIQALKILQENQPDVALVDVKLDGSPLDGFGILQEAKKLTLKTKIFIVTGYHDEEKEAKAKTLGADGYLTKPLPMASPTSAVQKQTSFVFNGLREF